MGTPRAQLTTQKRPGAVGRPYHSCVVFGAHALSEQKCVFQKNSILAPLLLMHSGDPKKVSKTQLSTAMCP